MESLALESAYARLEGARVRGQVVGKIFLCRWGEEEPGQVPESRPEKGIVDVMGASGRSEDD